MSEITAQLRIDAPAERVWEVIGPGFARIGEWASVIPASAPVAVPAAAPGAGLPGAGQPAATAPPVAGRVCTTGSRVLPQVTELLVAYDPARHTLTYQASDMPTFVTLARNTWTVLPDGEHACLVTLNARFEARGVPGLLARWVVAIQSRRNARLLQADLRHYLRHGTPSPRKQRQLSHHGRSSSSRLPASATMATSVGKQRRGAAAKHVSGDATVSERFDR